MDQSELADLTTTALARAVDGDDDGAAMTVCEIGIRSSPDQFDVYKACCGFAEAGRQALVKLYGGRVPDPARGETWAMLPLGAGEADAPDTFSMRFLVAFANGDQPTMLALWRAALLADNDQYVASVASLLRDVATLVRKANEL
ncbi:hypothetical protein [Streptomyces sp. BSE6.1]|uniref:hypothetical protein n=1 Tax=Streptomyces sp. BSE6.1 TaxID=2605730 RepID=UPI001F44E9AE|nr:hypothetical protein [Streptomyces sp. BSE6.1]